jgi:hypothetical protein
MSELFGEIERAGQLWPEITLYLTYDIARIEVRMDLLYFRGYPPGLLKELVEFICRECRTLSMKAWPVEAQNPGGVTYAVNEAWREFRERPATFGDFEV